MTAEREKCAEILARHLECPLQTKETLLNAILEARDLARREALEDCYKVCPCDDCRRNIDRLPGRSLISQPSPTKSAGAESSNEPFTDGGGAAEVASTSVPAEPIPMRLVCPRCGTLHLDVGEFATKPHHTHACQQCGEVWRPAIVATVGVEFLPGFKNEPASASAPAEPDPYEDEWVTKVQEALDCLDLEPPDTEAWKRDEREAFENWFGGQTRVWQSERFSNSLAMWEGWLERAARAKRVGK